MAVSDAMGWTAQGVTVIRRRSLAEDLGQLRSLAEEYAVKEIVVGLSVRMAVTGEAEKMYQFGDELKRTLKLPVEYWDERFSTVVAERTLLEGDVSRAKRRQLIDKVAATVILQSYLDHRG